MEKILSNRYYAPNLFPEVNRFPRWSDRRDYVQEVMVRLAKNNELYLTDLYNQSLELKDMSGMILLGQDINEKQVVSALIPDELLNYKVKLKLINGHEEILYKKGKRVYRTKVMAKNKKIDVYEDIFETLYGNDEGILELNIRDAWLVLRQVGKLCRRAKTQKAQETLWKCEEVKPVPKPTEKSKLENLFEELGGQAQVVDLLERLKEQQTKTKRSK